MTVDVNASILFLFCFIRRDILLLLQIDDAHAAIAAALPRFRLADAFMPREPLRAGGRRCAHTTPFRAPYTTMGRTFFMIWKEARRFYTRKDAKTPTLPARNAASFMRARACVPAKENDDSRRRASGSLPRFLQARQDYKVACFLAARRAFLPRRCMIFRSEAGMRRMPRRRAGGSLSPSPRPAIALADGDMIASARFPSRSRMTDRFTLFRRRRR